MVRVRFRPGLDAVAVGDWVAVEDDLVTAIVPRTGLVRRADVDGEREQPIAANVDLVVVVCGLDRPVRAGRIERVATLARDAGAQPVVVLTKADLVPDAEARARQVASEHPGIDVLAVSSTEGAGLDHVRRALRGRTVVLIGESGSGKSTLTNALLGEEVAATGAVRRGDAKGRHTTTTRHLHRLPGGGTLIDSPGVRAVGLTADADGVAETFSDVAVLAEHCRFRDCAHDTEPGCAVQAAVAAGEIPARRVTAWRALRDETVEAATHADSPWLHRPRRRR